MAKPIELITELHGADARRFIEEMENPSPNPKRDAFLKESAKINKFIPKR